MGSIPFAAGVGKLLEGDGLLFDQSDLATLLCCGVDGGLGPCKHPHLTEEAVESLQLVRGEEVVLNAVEGFVESGLELGANTHLALAHLTNLNHVGDRVVIPTPAHDVGWLIPPRRIARDELHPTLKANGNVVSSNATDVFGDLLLQRLDVAIRQLGDASVSGAPASGGIRCQRPVAVHGAAFQLGLHLSPLLRGQVG